MPDATVSLIERTIQEADSFCPCNHVPHRGNVCCGQGVCILASCKYPGHAAIRNLARVVLAAAAECEPDAYMKRKILDLIPEEVKQT